MKKILFFILIASFSLFAFPLSGNSQRKSYKPQIVHVKSYTTKKGKHVRSHYRSKPTRKKISLIIYPGTIPYRKESSFFV